MPLPTNTRTSTEEDHEALLSVREVAAKLNISLTSAYRLLSAGAVPCRRIGGSRRVRPEDLELYIEASLEQSP